MLVAGAGLAHGGRGDGAVVDVDLARALGPGPFAAAPELATGVAAALGYPPDHPGAADGAGGREGLGLGVGRQRPGLGVGRQRGGQGHHWPDGIEAKAPFPPSGWTTRRPAMVRGERAGRRTRRLPVECRPGRRVANRPARFRPRRAPWARRAAGLPAGTWPSVAGRLPTAGAGRMSPGRTLGRETRRERRPMSPRATFVPIGPNQRRRVARGDTATLVDPTVLPLVARGDIATLVDPTVLPDVARGDIRPGTRPR